MMDEELHLQTAAIFRSAIVITVATLVSHLDPLFPLIWAPRTTALILALVLSALVLFGVDVYEAVTLVGDCARKPADPRNRLGAARDRLRDRPSVPRRQLGTRASPGQAGGLSQFARHRRPGASLTNPGLPSTRIASLVLSFACYVNLVRFSFMILIGRFVG